MRAFPSELAPPTKPVTIPLDKLSAVLDFWIAWLGLAGWTHRCVLSTPTDFGDTSQHGAAVWDLATSHFNIALLDPDHAAPDEGYDMEQTLVHELLHVRFASWTDQAFPPGTRGGVLWEMCAEQPIERVAIVLTELGRAHPSHPLKRRRRR